MKCSMMINRSNKTWKPQIFKMKSFKMCQHLLTLCIQTHRCELKAERTQNPKLGQIDGAQYLIEIYYSFSPLSRWLKLLSLGVNNIQ